MARENELIDMFIKEMPWLKDRIRTPRQKRIFTDALTQDEFMQLMDYANTKAGFTRMTHVVGTDDGEMLGFIYILSDDSGILLAMHETAPKEDPVIESLTPRFPSLEWHERELVDLFGAVVKNLPDGPSYPLPDNWPAGQFPLRKEWDPSKFNRETMTYEEEPKSEQQQ
jgi:membrane-bound hydrogenase subunit beta